MIIDIHGHYTTAPDQLAAYRGAQLARLADSAASAPSFAEPTDDALRESVADHQLAVLRARGGDMMLFSPKASGMEHHVTDQPTANAWARVSNDLVHRVTTLFPAHFAPVCQLPQTPGGPLAPVVAELRRCVGERGFVGANLNPDPSGGHWDGPPLGDPYWYPLYEALCELDVPAMVHVSTSLNPHFHTLGAHYLNADTAVFTQLLSERPLHPLPPPAPRPAARRRRRPLPLGPLPGARRTARQARPRDAARQRLLRHLRLPPARHRPAHTCAARAQRALRLRDARRGTRRGPRDGRRLGRHRALPRPAPDSPPTTSPSSRSTTRDASTPGSTRSCAPRDG
ncbi:LOW QUALITY PROTEIN: 4-oxalomesaconate hydratase, partial [Streptomyces sp. SPB78]